MLPDLSKSRQSGKKVLPDVAKNRQRDSKGFQGVPRYGSATPGDLRAGTLRVRGARLPAEGRQAIIYKVIM